MKINNLTYKLGISIIASAMIVGCGGSSSASTTSTTISGGTLVDPYISGAKMYYDANNNGLYDSTEQLSTATDASGAFTFASAVPVGSSIRLHPSYKGTHNGAPFTGDLSANISSTGVVSPLTTLGSKGFTNAEIITLLGNAGITITEDDINADPMVGLNGSNNSATADDLKNIQAAVAVNTFFGIVGTGATKANINANTANLTKAVNLIKQAITPAKVSGADADTVLKVAVSISDYLVEKTALDGNSTVLDSYINSTTGKMDSAVNTLASAISGGNAHPTWNGSSAGNASNQTSLNGRVIDNAIPNARVQLKVNGTVKAVTNADSQGNYNISYDYSSLGDTDKITMLTVDPSNSKNVFESSLGTGKRLKAGLTGDNKIDTTDIPDVAVSNVTTAKAAMAKVIGGSTIDPLTYDKVMEDNGAIVTAMASAIKYSVDNDKTLTVDGNSSMNMATFAATVAGKYQTYNPSAPMTNIESTIASYVTDVNTAELKTMNKAILSVDDNPELAGNTVKAGTNAYQLSPGTYGLMNLVSTEYKDRDDYTKRHPSTYWGTQNSLVVKFEEITVGADTIIEDEFTSSYVNGFVSGSEAAQSISDGTMHRDDFEGWTLTYNDYNKLIAVATGDVSWEYKTVKDDNGYISFSGYGMETMDWSSATVNGDNIVIDTSKNNNFLDSSGNITATHGSNSASNNWDMVDEKLTKSMSGVITGNGLSKMPYTTIAGLNDTTAVDAKLKIWNNGTWKEISLNLSTDGDPVIVSSGNNSSGYNTMTIDGDNLPMSFNIEFSPTESGTTTTALVLGGNITDGTSTDNLSSNNLSFFKDGFVYLQLASTNLGYKHIVIDLVNNVGYALSDYAQININADGTLGGSTSYWVSKRSKVNFVK